jgi:serine/threonine protein kinase
MPGRFRQSAEIFLAACDRNPSERAAYITEVCGSDEQLRSDVESLLAFDLEPEGDGSVTGKAAPVAIPDYELLRPIGHGGVGEVWLGRNGVDGRFRAVKIFPDAIASERDGLREYAQRVEEHPNLVPVEHVGHVEGHCYCVMPLADSADAHAPVLDPDQYEPLTLATELERRGPLPAPEVAEIGRAILAGLDHLHRRGARHGDVNPANIIRLHDRWQLADHGLVSDLGRTRVPGFTPAYCPPEGPGGRGSDL